MIFPEITDKQLDAIDGLLQEVTLTDAAWHQITFYYNQETGKITYLAALPILSARIKVENADR